MKIPIRHTRSGMAIAACASLVTTQAYAQETMEEKGPTICIPHVIPSAPGLRGGPKWPTLQYAAPTDPTDPQVRADVQEPRWGNAPLTGFIYKDDDKAFARYRLMHDPRDTSTDADDELLVSIQVLDDPNSANELDRVHFGISNNGNTAFGVQIPIYGSGVDNPATPETETPRGQHVPPDPAFAETFVYASGSWTRTGGLPGWIHDIVVWNDPAKQGENGAAWAVNFRVSMQDVGLSPGDDALVNMGAWVKEDADAFSGVVLHAVPNTLNGCDGTGGACTLEGPFFFDPAQWTPTSQIDEGCLNGIVIEGRDVGTNHPDGSNRVRILNGQANTFQILPQYNGVPVQENLLVARLRISNWGTLADPQTSWNTLLGSTDATFDDSSEFWNKVEVLGSGKDSSGNDVHLTYPCSNTGSGQNVCELDLDTSLHQCMHAELRARDGRSLEFTRATAWKNTYFVEASEVSEPAEIKVEGLEALLGNSDDRDVYLHVVTTNMPTAGSDPMTLDVDALEALRQQVDPFFDGGGYCENRTDLCIPQDSSEAPGVCIFELPASDEFGCFPLDEVEFGDRVFCIREETCTVAPNGGHSPLLTAMDKAQILTAYYPTIMIYPYYDSGQTMNIDGEDTVVMTPMYPFGLHVKHVGEFFGWLNGLVGPNLEEIGPDFYRIRVPNEGRVGIDVKISAEESEHYKPFTEIAGTATTLGWNIDTVNLTGVAHTPPTDLRTATVNIEQMLHDGGRELVANLQGPRTLTPLPGALPSLATFTGSGSGAGILMEVLDIPLVGRVVNVTVLGATVRRPSACGWFGTATLGTQFGIINDSVSETVFRGEDQWSCVPTTIFNY